MCDPPREGRRWLPQAEVDLEAAGALRDRFPALAFFHAQQSAEKALKAVLYGSGERQVLGLSVAELGEAVERLDPEYGALRVGGAKLDRYYIPTRYPNGLPLGTDPSTALDLTDADAAIATAGKIVVNVADFLGETRGR